MLVEPREPLEPNGGEIQLLFDCTAMAKRIASEMLEFHKSVYEYRGSEDDFVEPPESIIQIIATAQGYMLRDMVASNRIRTATEYVFEISASIDDQDMREIFGAEEDEEIDSEALRQEFTGFLLGSLESANTMDLQSRTEELSDEYQRASIYANDHDATVEALYSDKEEYIKLVRSIFTPAEYAQKGLKIAKQMSLDQIAASIKSQLSMQALVDPEAVEAEEAEKPNNPLENFDFNNHVIAEHEMLRRLYAQFTLKKLEQIWGEGAALQLSAELKAELEDMAREPSQPIVDVGRLSVGQITSVRVDFKKREHPRNFALRYCLENGIDPNSLTPQDILAIRKRQ